MITLGALVLPSGLVWSDEYSWTPIAQSSPDDRSLTGALLVQESIKYGGRPVTLEGQQDGSEHTAWLRRSQSHHGLASLEELRAVLLAPLARMMLTLHDGRQLSVAPRHDGDGPLKVRPRSVYKSMAQANPGPDYLYYLESIRLIEILL